MTQPQAEHAVPENDPDKADAAVAAPAAVEDAELEVAPEPWTPERVSEWNAYYDLYVLLATLLLVFIVSCNYVTGSSLFTHLKAGQLIHERGGPLTTDVFTYSHEGERWVDVPWLFQWSHAALYNLVYGLVPVDPNVPTANLERADQLGIGALVALAALARLATAWLLIALRHKGPGLWWSALCAALAFGAIVHPIGGAAMGGISGVPGVAPSTGGVLFLAFEIWAVHRAFGKGKPWALWALVPLFVLWANWDTSFLVGLLVLAAAALGRWLDGENADWLVANAQALEPARTAPEASSQPVLEEESDAAPRSARARSGFLVLALCALAVLVNPWTFHAFTAAVKPFVEMLRPAEQLPLARLSFFSAELREALKDEWFLLPVYYLVLVFVGTASFYLNLDRFVWSRFLPFAVVAVLWGVLMRFSAEFAVVFAAVLALNGQEWYLARFGASGRLGRSWTVWSTGGRLVTLALLFLAVGFDITGWRNVNAINRFGLGYDPDDFPIAAAEFLGERNDLKGNVLNTSLAQGDLLNWKAHPRRKPFLDGRPDGFTLADFEEWHKIRKALSEDDAEAWKPLLDKHGITAVMIDPADSRTTYGRLMQSPGWVPFHDDGATVIFGRADAPASDLAVFQANRLDPERVYRDERALPSAEGPPGQTSWIDRIFQNRAFHRRRRRNDAALRWLNMGARAGEQPLPEPAQCLRAIQEARIALSQSPDDWMAFRVLNEAYRYLAIQETAILGGLAIAPENRARAAMIQPDTERLMNRFRQRTTALRYAIQTAPPPEDALQAQPLFELNMELVQLYMSVNFRDLARDRLQIALELSERYALLAPEARAQFVEQFNQLNEQVKQVEDQMDELSLENQAGPLDLAAYAQRQGAVGLAIAKLAEAERNGISPAIVKPQLVDLYCLAGQPEKALDLFAMGSAEDPNLGAEPGTAAYRQGLVYFLLGNYYSTASLWQDRAIARARDDRSNRMLSAGQGFARGRALMATDTFLTLVSGLGQQAMWEYDLAICELEGGRPANAAEHFTKALVLQPELAVRPIAEYYLKKMGKPVPPAADAARAGQPAGATSVGKPETPSPSAPAPPSDAPARKAERPSAPAPADGSSKGKEEEKTKSKAGEKAGGPSESESKNKSAASKPTR